LNFINLVKDRLVSLANAYNSIGLIKVERKNLVDEGLGVMLKFSPIIRFGMLVNVTLIKKNV